ncbi:MAG: N-6 DNA methylase [Cyanobacteriota bacterium]|nr:N-6 DNA methylase [Cyanobacteriota bacterium]
MWQGNTLTDPKAKEGGPLKPSDFVVANPPLFAKRWSNSLDPASDPFGRFKGFGFPPKKTGRLCLPVAHRAHDES